MKKSIILLGILAFTLSTHPVFAAGKGNTDRRAIIQQETDKAQKTAEKKKRKSAQKAVKQVKKQKKVAAKGTTKKDQRKTKKAR